MPSSKDRISYFYDGNPSSSSLNLYSNSFFCLPLNALISGYVHSIGLNIPTQRREEKSIVMLCWWSLFSVSQIERDMNEEGNVFLSWESALCGSNVFSFVWNDVKMAFCSWVWAAAFMTAETLDENAILSFSRCIHVDMFLSTKL